MVSGQTPHTSLSGSFCGFASVLGYVPDVPTLCSSRLRLRTGVDVNDAVLYDVPESVDFYQLTMVVDRSRQNLVFGTDGYYRTQVFE